MFIKKFILILIIHLRINLILCFDAYSITTALASGGVSIGKYLVDHTYCKLKECCNEDHIPADFEYLRRVLDVRVYGQHLAKRTVVDALKSHWRSPHAKKALTMSFHGRPGTGKNYVSKFITESMFKEGSSSAYVHHFMGRIHFPSEQKTDEYKKNLYAWIKGNVTSCPYQVFIFDEVDKMPAGILDVLKPIIDYNENIEKVDYRKAIFIFLSNTGGTLIIDEMMKLWRSGKTRENIKLSDFDQLISLGAFNEKGPSTFFGWLHWHNIWALAWGGFHHSDTIKSNLIDHYIPFLPMELEHVQLCIKDEFLIRGIHNPKSEHIKEVIDFIAWGPEPENKFSNTGCKRLSQKVAIIAEKSYPKRIEF